MLGVHCSVSGGLHHAYDEANELEITAMQIFTRNQRQWKSKPISEEEKDSFLRSKSKSKVAIAFSHCSYLINLAAESDETRSKSIDALTHEVSRCNTLELSYCVLHPGAAGKQQFDLAIKKVADGLDQVFKIHPNSKAMVLLENTAGQGTSVGGEFENLHEIRDLVQANEHIGYCFDTCHAFAAGYDIRTIKGCEDTFKKFDDILGLENLKVFHLNDSKGTLGSHLDRHENIGHGKLGNTPFEYIMKNFPNIPKVIETTKEDDWDRINLELLRSFI